MMMTAAAAADSSTVGSGDPQRIDYNTTRQHHICIQVVQYSIAYTESLSTLDTQQQQQQKLGKPTPLFVYTLERKWGGVSISCVVVRRSFWPATRCCACEVGEVGGGLSGVLSCCHRTHTVQCRPRAIPLHSHT